MTNDRHARGERQARVDVGRVSAGNLRLAYAAVPDGCPESFGQLLERLKGQGLLAKDRTN